MFSPGPPPLVEAGPPPFIPPPEGVSNGGEPGFFSAFPGARGGGFGGGEASNPDWIPGIGTPYPTQRPPLTPASWGQSTSWGPPPNSAPATSWHHGNYVPATSPAWPPYSAAGPPTTPVWPPATAATPAWGQQPAAAWGAPSPNTTSWGPTPAATWGAPSPNTTSWGVPATPTTPAAYPATAPPWGQPSQPQGYFGGRASGPSTPYESDQPITAGWFGAGGEGGGGGGGWGEMPAYGRHTPGADLERKRSTRSKSRHRSNSESMRRSNSLGPDGRVQRSTSWGGAAGDPWAQWDAFGRAQESWGSHANPGGYGEQRPAGYPPSGYPGWAQGDLFDERNLSRRPRDWRPDYNPRGIALAAYLPRVGRSRSDVKEWADVTRRALHPLLHYHPSTPPVSFDLRDPAFNPSTISFLNLRRAPNQIDYAQLAFQPSTPFARLYHPKLPWYVDVHQVHPNGVTVGDILEQVHRQLQTPIHPRHFWNEELGEAERAVITRAFQERCGRDTGMIGRGVVQADFLGRKVVFEGLARGQKGLWEIKTSRME